MSKKKRSRRVVPYGDKPRHYSHSNQWKVDQDYWDKLSPEERNFLKTFNKEWTEGSFKTSRPLHKTKKQRRECYDNNNRSKRDIMNKGVVSLEQLNSNQSGLNLNESDTSYTLEDALIKVIDKTKKR